jgi:predicted RNase H-like HicB family nuclease
VPFILSDYIDAAMDLAVYERLEDGTYAGRIPVCRGVLALASSLRGCEGELRSVLEDWILLRIKLRHPLPVIAGVDLNREPVREPADAL